jgi:hypothetical protein
MIPPTRNYASATKSVMQLDIAVIQMLIQKKHMTSSIVQTPLLSFLIPLKQKGIALVKYIPSA